MVRDRGGKALYLCSSSALLRTTPICYRRGLWCCLVVWVDGESSADNESQVSMSRTSLLRVGCAELEPRSCMEHPCKVSCRDPECLWSATSERFPHLMVCGLFNHYIPWCASYLYGVSGPFASGGVLGSFRCRPPLAPFFPLRLDSAMAYNLLVIPLGFYSSSPSSLTPSASPWWLVLPFLPVTNIA